MCNSDTANYFGMVFYRESQKHFTCNSRFDCDIFNYRKVRSLFAPKFWSFHAAVLLEWKDDDSLWQQQKRRLIQRR